jgi:hypothetical protein
MSSVQLVGPPNRAFKFGLIALAAVSIIFGTIGAAGNAVHPPWTLANN